MKYLVPFLLVLGLVACDPGEVISIQVNPPPGVQDAVDGLQQGADQLNNSIQNFGEENEGDSGGEED